CSLARISARVLSAVPQTQPERGSRAQPPHMQRSWLNSDCSTGSWISTDPACSDDDDCPNARAGVSASRMASMIDETPAPAARRNDHARASSSATSGHIETTAPTMRTRTPVHIHETSGLTCTWNVATLLSGLTLPTTT